jgi:predicted PurR-regulated permease PerM
VRVVGGYLKGQTVASLVTGALAGVGLAILGVPYALVLAIITFIFNYVPYVGPLLSGLLAGAAGAFVSPLTAVLAIAVVIGAQQLTDLFVTPRVMSEQVDLHPVLVIFSLLVGGTLFGFWGLIFAIPVAATVSGLFVYYYERRTNRPLASEDGALFKSAQCDDDADEDCDDEQAPAAHEDTDTKPHAGS